MKTNAKCPQAFFLFWLHWVLIAAGSLLSYSLLAP